MIFVCASESAVVPVLLLLPPPLGPPLPYWADKIWIVRNKNDRKYSAGNLNGFIINTMLYFIR